MGGFNLTKMKTPKIGMIRRGSISKNLNMNIDLFKTATTISNNNSNTTNKPPPLRSATPPTPGMQSDVDSEYNSSSEEGIEVDVDYVDATSIAGIATYTSLNDDTTLSSMHSDSLTSFMGNLSPPTFRLARSYQQQHQHQLDDVEEVGGYGGKQELASPLSVHHDHDPQEQSPGKRAETERSVDVSRSRSASSAMFSKSKKSASSKQELIRCHSSASARKTTPPPTAPAEASTPSSSSSQQIRSHVHVEVQVVDTDHTIETIGTMDMDILSGKNGYNNIGNETLDSSCDTFQHHHHQQSAQQQHHHQQQQGEDIIYYFPTSTGVSGDVHDDYDDDDDHSTVSLFDDEGNQFVFNGDATPSEINKVILGESSTTRYSSKNSIRNGTSSNELKKAHMNIAHRSQSDSGCSAVVKHLNALYEKNTRESANNKHHPSTTTATGGMMVKNRITKIVDAEDDIVEVQNVKTWSATTAATATGRRQSGMMKNEEGIKKKELQNEEETNETEAEEKQPEESALVMPIIANKEHAADEPTTTTVPSSNITTQRIVPDKDQTTTRTTTTQSLSLDRSVGVMKNSIRKFTVAKKIVSTSALRQSFRRITTPRVNKRLTQ